MPSTETSPSVAADQLTRALGEAVIRIWSDLPQEVQDHLFKGAVASRGESIRSQLAVFLHDKHPRTLDPLGNPRDMKEPDSLGGYGVARRRKRDARPTRKAIAANFVSATRSGGASLKSRITAQCDRQGGAAAPS